MAAAAAAANAAAIAAQAAQILAIATAAQASAQAAQSAVELIRQQSEYRRSEKSAEKPGTLAFDPLKFPLWDLTRASYSSQKKDDWCYEVNPAQRYIHPNYPVDPSLTLAPVAYAATLAAVREKRAQQQRDVHHLLVTC